MQIFALGSSKPFGERVVAALGIELGRHEERRFEDGEHKFRPLASVRGRDVYAIASLYGEPGASTNDKLCELLFFLGAVKDAGAARVTAVTPYLPYLRKDRRTKPRDPLTSRYIAQLFEAIGVDTLVTVDAHNVSAIQNAFRRQCVHLDTRRLFSTHLRKRIGNEPVVVASPDPGGIKRAQLFRESVESIVGRSVEFAFMEKRRSAGVVSGATIAGDVTNATVLIVDDLISSGGTMARAAQAFREAGAAKSYAVAAHGLFVGDAAGALTGAPIAMTFISDTIPPFRLPEPVVARHIEIVSAAPLFAEAIRRLHANQSITELLGGAS